MAKFATSRPATMDELQAEIDRLHEGHARIYDENQRLRDENARLLAERDHARLRYDRAVRILTGIHALLYPPRFTDHDGRTWQFKSPLAEEQMQELSDRIRALPDEIAAIDAAMQKGE